MAETLSRYLGRALAEIVPGFGGLQRSDFVRRIAYPFLRADRGGHLPSLGTSSDSVDQVAVRAAIVSCTPQLVAAADLASQVLAAGLALAEADGAPLGPGTISEEIATRVAGWLRSQSGSAAEELVARWALEIQPGAKAMTKVQFSRSQNRAYAESWRTHGEPEWSAWPPSDYLLGPDEAPSLLPAGAENILVGSSRSVYGRYRAYFKDSAATRTDRGCGHVRCAEVTIPPASGRPERTIRQVCGGLGVLHREHRVLLTSLRWALVDEPIQRDGNWSEYAADDQDLPTSGIDNELVERINGHLYVWQKGRSAAVLRRTFGDLGVNWEVFTRAGVLKTYAEVLRWERERDQPMGRCGAAAIAAIAITQGIPRLGRELLAPTRGGQLHESRAGSAPASRSVAYTHRFDRTMLLLTDHLDIVLAYRADAHDWRDRYRQWADDHEPDTLLTLDEFDLWMSERGAA